MTACTHPTRYLRTGMLIFRDRLRWQQKGAPARQAAALVQQFIRRRRHWRGFFSDEGGGGVGGALPPTGATTPPPQWPWIASADMLDSPIARGLAHHHTDSSVLLLSKQRAPRVVSALYLMHERYRHEMYYHLHGDKETCAEMRVDAVSRRGGLRISARWTPARSRPT